MREAGLTIGEAAEALGVSTDTLRYYERSGLLPKTPRAANGYRYYDRNALRRVRFIRHAQQVGFTLEEAHALMRLRGNACACCQDVRGVALTKRAELEHKIKMMAAMAEALSVLIDVCVDDHGSLDDCPILAALEQNLEQHR